MEGVPILGIDPGLRHVGWGIILVKGNQYSHVAHGVIHPNPELPMAERLRLIFEGLTQVIAQHNPQEAAIEETFVNKNEASALKLGMARGVAMLAPALIGLPVFEYGANKIKKTIVGVGHADKQQVLMMVKVLLPKANVTQTDAADALAVALCHAHHRNILFSKIA